MRVAQHQEAKLKQHNVDSEAEGQRVQAPASKFYDQVKIPQSKSTQNLIFGQQQALTSYHGVKQMQGMVSSTAMVGHKAAAVAQASAQVFAKSLVTEQSRPGAPGNKEREQLYEETMMKQLRQSQENIKQRAMLNELQAKKNKNYFGRNQDVEQRQQQRLMAQYNTADSRDALPHALVNPFLKSHQDLSLNEEVAGPKEKKMQINHHKLNLIKANIELQKSLGKSASQQ